MLNIIRSNTRTIIWIFITLFILWCIGEAINFSGNKTTIGVVNGKKIHQTKFQQFYKIVYFSPRYQELLNKQMLLPDDFIEDTALQYIAIYQKAKKDKVKVTDDEVKQAILERFSAGGYFDSNLYNRWVKNVFKGQPHQYEDGVKKELTIYKFLESLADDVTIKDEEVYRTIGIENTNFQIDYLPLSTDIIQNIAEPTEEELLELYEEKKDSFKEDEKYDLSFLHFDPANFLSAVQVTEEDFLQFYETTFKDQANKPEFTMIKDQLKEELIKRTASNLANEESKRIAEIIEETKNFGKGQDAAGFGALRTGMKSAQELVKIFGYSANFEESLANATKSNILRLTTSKGSYVILLSDKEYAFTPPFKIIRDKVRDRFIHLQKQQKLHELSNKLMGELKEGKTTLTEIASQYNRTIITSPLFHSKSKELQNIGPVAPLINQLYDIDINTYLEPLQVQSSFVLIQLIKKETLSSEEIEERFSKQKARLLTIKKDQIKNIKLTNLLKEAKIENLLKTRKDPFADVK